MAVVEEFVEAVREYLELIESLEDFDEDVLLMTSARLLPLIYSLAIQLPAPHLPSRHQLEPVDDADVRGTHVELLRAILDKKDAYYHYYHPYDRNSSQAYSVAEELDEIYWDLKEPFDRYMRGNENSMGEALWDWKFNFTLRFCTARSVVAAMCAISEHVRYSGFPFLVETGE